MADSIKGSFQPFKQLKFHNIYYAALNNLRLFFQVHSTPCQALQDADPAFPLEASRCPEDHRPIEPADRGVLRPTCRRRAGIADAC